MATLNRPALTEDHVLTVLERRAHPVHRYHRGQLVVLQSILEGLHNYGGKNGPLTILSSRLNTHDDIFAAAYGIARSYVSPSDTWVELLSKKRGPETRKRFFFSARARGMRKLNAWRYNAQRLHAEDYAAMMGQNPFLEGIESRCTIQGLILLDDQIRGMKPLDAHDHRVYTRLLRADQVARHVQHFPHAPFVRLKHIPPVKAGLSKRLRVYARYIAAHANTYMRSITPPTQGSLL